MTSTTATTAPPMNNMTPIEWGSVVITGCGVLANSMSLTYFITRKNKALMTKILLLLNSFDFCVCVASTITTMTWRYMYDSTFWEIVNAVYKCSLEGTAFATCLLTVTRTISLCRPFHRINDIAVILATFLFLGYVAVKCTSAAVLTHMLEENNQYEAYIDIGYVSLSICSIFLIVAVVIASNAIAVRTLWKGSTGVARLDRAAKINQRATITILILSCLFCFFNIAYLAFLSLVVYVEAVEERHIYQKTIIIQGLAYNIAIPLNSAINPAVYFIRKRSMRDYVLELPKRRIEKIRKSVASFTTTQSYMLARTSDTTRL